MSVGDIGILELAEALGIGDSILNDYLEMTGNTTLDFWDPERSEYTVRALNEGLFHILLTCYSNGMERFSNYDISSGFGSRAVYLGAYAMKLGITIGADDMDILHAAFDKVTICPKARAQMNEALTHYKSNGEEWDFKEGHHLSKMDLDPNPSTSGGDVKDTQGQCARAQKRPRDYYNDADENQKAAEETSGHRSKQQRRSE